MDRMTSIATFVAQSTRGDSACAVPQHTARQTSIRGLPDSAPLPTSSHRTGKSARFLGPLPRARTLVSRTKDATDRKPRVHRSGGSYVVELYRGASSQRDRQQSPGRADRAVSGTRRSTRSGLGSRLMRRSPAARAIDLDCLPIRLSPTATSGSVRPCSWTFTSVAIFGSHNRCQSSSDFSLTMRPVPATWRRLAGATGSFAPIVRRRESRSASQIVLASCAAASAAVTPD